MKPSFFQNEQLAELPFEARLLFVGLWCMADREGRLEDRPKRIKMNVFPADSIDVVPLLDGLEEQGLIERYESHGVECIEIPKFVEHQRPHHQETASKLPPNIRTKARSPSHQGTSLSALNPDLLIPESSLREVPPPAGLDLQAWNRWNDYRREIRKPIKPASVQAAQRKLAGFGADQAKVVEQSVAQGWTGLFDVKEQGNGTRKQVSQPRVSAVERVRLANEKWLSDSEDPSSGGVVIDA